MKKIFMLTLIFAMLTCTACGDTAEKEPVDSSADVSQSESEVINASDSESSIEETEATEENEAEESFYDFSGLSVPEPENLEYIDWGAQGYYNWIRESEEENLYFAICICGMDYSDYEDVDSYTSEDVWEILNNEMTKNIDNYYSVYELDDAEVSTKENIDFLGTEFIRSTGSMLLEARDDVEFNIYYSACYGAIDFPAYGTSPEYKKVPLMFIAFSDTDSDDIKAEMEKIIDNTVENSSWLSDEQ